MANIFLQRFPDIAVWLGVLGFLVLAAAPGAWITFGLSLGDMPFWAALLTGITLSPIVVCAEFYALRLAGIPFGTAAIGLVLLNLPALYFLWRRIPVKVRLAPASWLLAAAAVVIPLAAMAYQIIQINSRIFSAHTWIYADPVYMFAKGDLFLEDPSLAGVKLGYPIWSALVFQAVHSFLVNSAPVSSYVWENLLWLAVIFAFAMLIAKELGGGRLAQVASGVLLLFGTNPIGYLLTRLVPTATRYRLWGDPRYTPWISKFYSFSTMPMAMAMLMAVIYLMIRPQALTKMRLVPICLLVGGIGLFYPLLFPPACGLLAAKALAVAYDEHNGRWKLPVRDWAVLGLAVLLVVAVTAVQLKFITSDRDPAASALLLSTAGALARKTVAGLVATSLLCIGLVFVFRECWKSRRQVTIVLAGGALASYALHALFAIPYWSNEYKFIFTATMCLSGFAGVAAEQVWRRLPRWQAVAILAPTALLIAIPSAHHQYVIWHRKGEVDARIDARRFYLDIADKKNSNQLCDATRRLTPPETILLDEQSDFYLPALTNRSLYVAPEDRGYPGVTLSADVLVGDVRGNGRSIISRRRAELTDLFHGPEPTVRDAALRRILALQRPIAIVLEPRHSGLKQWLEKQHIGGPVYSGDEAELWLIQARPSEAIEARNGRKL